MTFATYRNNHIQYDVRDVLWSLVPINHSHHHPCYHLLLETHTSPVQKVAQGATRHSRAAHVQLFSRYFLFLVVLVNSYVFLAYQTSTVPEWYYACIFGELFFPRRLICDLYSSSVATFAFACVCVQVWDTGLPIWALIVALLIGRHFHLQASKLQDSKRLCSSCLYRSYR